MTHYNYSTEIGEKDAAAVGLSLPISPKQSIEICNFLRGKKLERVKKELAEVLNEKTAIPFKRFTDGIGHKPGNLTSGRYPKKACGEILKMLNSAQANAQFKGLSSADLVVRHIIAQRASKVWHYGRKRAQAKRTTIEIVLTEMMETGKKKAKPSENKEAVKPAEKKEEPKKVEEKKETPKAEPKKAEEKKPEPAKKEVKVDDKKELPKEESNKSESKASDNAKQVSQEEKVEK